MCASFPCHLVRSVWIVSRHLEPMWPLANQRSPYNSSVVKMPVKIDYSSNRFSPSPFDCNSMLLNDFDDQFISDINLSSFDDIWNNFIPTPPQSPNMKLDRMEYGRADDLLDDNLSDFDQKLIHHDCMWSGQCSEGLCNSLYNKPTSRSCVRSETPFNLSTSPINTSSYISSFDININESLTNFLEEDAQDQQPVEGNVYAMENDHSYESSIPAPKEDIVNDNSQNKSSLIRKPITAKIINQGKITKIKCKKIGSKKFSESSILNSNISRTSKNETSVLKPTIISVSNFKNLQDSSLAKYKVAIKKNKINFIDGKSTSARQIQINNVPTVNKISAQLISPNSSDSEESSLSFSSGEDNRKTSPPFRRREHNDSERKRRDHLRNSFNNLKDQIPKLKSAEKRPPRIMILHEATSYVTQLIDTNNTLEKTLEEELEKKKRLLNILKNLNKDSC